MFMASKPLTEATDLATTLQTCSAQEVHSLTHRAILLTTCLGLLACGGEVPDDASEPELLTELVDVPAAVLEASGGGERATFASGKPTVLFLNYGGVVITKGPGSDATKNLSFIGGGKVPPFSGGSATRDAATTLIKQLYKRYNIQVVTKRPASGDYDMVVIGGSPADLGLAYPSKVAGVAPMDCGDKMPRDIGFIFSKNLMLYYSGEKLARRLAETSSHEAAHTYGLPHSDDGCDVMSYKKCVNLKTFLDKKMAMQSDSVGKCGLTSMNSHKLLLAALGPAPPPPADTKAPVVTITAPEPGLTLNTPALTVQSVISDAVGVTRGELLVGGKVAASRKAPPFDFTAVLDEGQHTLTVRGHDAAGNTGSASVTVSVRLPRLQPLTGGGTTVAAPPPGGIDLPVPGPGAGITSPSCWSDEECGGGICGEDGTCAPGGEDSILTGGCSAGGRPRPDGVPLSLLLLLLLLSPRIRHTLD
jgi:hypothetical protein